MGLQKSTKYEASVAPYAILAGAIDGRCDQHTRHIDRLTGNGSKILRLNTSSSFALHTAPLRAFGGSAVGMSDCADLLS